MTTTSASEAEMIDRLEELLRVRAALWNDRDDPRTLSELTVTQAQINRLESELGIRRREDTR